MAIWLKRGASVAAKAATDRSVRDTVEGIFASLVADGGWTAE